MMPLELVAAAADEGCFWMDSVCVMGQLVSDVTQGVGNSALQGAADSFMLAWTQLEMFFLASWIMMPLLVDITNPDGTTFWLQDTLGTVTFAVAVMGALVTAGWTFLRLRSDKVTQLGWSLVRLLLISTSGALIIAGLDMGIREASIGILLAVGVSPTAAITSQVVTNTAMAVSPGITLIIGIVAVIGVIIQWIIMIARGPLVVLLVGVWPLAAAAAGLGGKKAESAYENITAWLIAFVIYPFPAALVYAAAFRLKGGADGLGGIMYGLVLEIFAVLLMPAIFRIIAPATRALGEKFGGKVAVDAAVSAAETAVTIGAAVVTAGAAAGAFAAKAGAAGAKAASASATQGATSTGGASGGGAAGGGGAAPSGAGAGAEAGTGAGSGADLVGAEQPEPTTTGTGAQPPGSAPGSTPPRGEDPPAAPAPAPRPPKPSTPSGGATTRRGAQAQAAAHAAQVASQSAGRAARKAVDDMDDIIGGQQ